MRSFKMSMWLATALAALALTGCEEEPQAIEPADDEVAAAEAAGPTGAAEAAEPAGEREAGPSVVTDSYELRADPVGAYQTGELGQLEVTITGKGEWHINQDFPTTVTMADVEGVSWAQPSLDKADAAEFGEEKARFEVPFTPEKAGEHLVRADVAFAICTEETCVPQRKKLALRLPVE